MHERILNDCMFTPNETKCLNMSPRTRIHLISCFHVCMMTKERWKHKTKSDKTGSLHVLWWAANWFIFVYYMIAFDIHFAVVKKPKRRYWSMCSLFTLTAARRLGNINYWIDILPYILWCHGVDEKIINSIANFQSEEEKTNTFKHSGGRGRALINVEIIH